MKRHFLLSFLLLSAGLLVFSTCKKDKTESSCSGDPSHCQRVTEAKDYFAFKMGSWWVYEEEHSGARDSVYVTESSIDPDGYLFDVRMYSSYQDYYYHYWPEYYGSTSIPSCSETEPVDKKCLYVEYTKYKPGEDYLGQSKCFFINAMIGDYVTTGFGTNYCTNNKITVEDKISNYSVVGTNYNTTYIVHEDCSKKEGNQEIKNYYSQGVGLVKKELLDSNQVWNLVSYHIAP